MSKAYSITSKFQVTIPKEVREDMGLSEDDKVRFVKEGDTYTMERVLTIKEIQKRNQAFLKKHDIKPATDEDIRNARAKYYKQHKNEWLP